jgi:hypothetical protein
MPQQSLRHVPWTCRWGRFGGPVEASAQSPRGFVFWVCGHPLNDRPRLLDRTACQECPLWEPGEEFRDSAEADRMAQV